MLDDEQKATQKDVTEISHAFQWIGMDVKPPYLNLEDQEFNSAINKVRMINITLLEIVLLTCKYE